MDFDPVVADDGGMRRLPLPLRVTTVGLALVLAGCGSTSETPDPAASSTPAAGTSTGTTSPSVSPSSPSSKPTPVTMTGTLAEGVESGCLVFRDEATGDTYSVTKPIAGPGTLGRVTVTGTVDPEMMSFCMQGPVLVVEDGTAAPASD